MSRPTGPATRRASAAPRTYSRHVFPACVRGTRTWSRRRAERWRSLPEEMDYVTAASLGCRFATSFRAVVAQGKVSGGQWVAVHGCGGVGLSAIMIAQALGAQVIAIDIDDAKLAFAQSIGAVATINAAQNSDIIQQVRELTKGGAHVSIDALGSPTTCFNSIGNLGTY